MNAPQTAGQETTSPANGLVSDVQESTVVATRLKLRNWLQLRRFFKVNGEVERQLKASPGLVTYSLKADFLRLHFSTLSVWKDDHSVGAFVGTGAHRQAIAVFDEIAVREHSGFVHWKTSAAQDVTWKEARQRVAGAIGTSLSEDRTASEGDAGKVR